jgi:hypothetical protein
MRYLFCLLGLPLILLAVDTAKVDDPFSRGEGISLASAIPANERGILCLAVDEAGRVYGGTTGRAAHFFCYDPKLDAIRSLVRLDGGVGFAHALIRLPDGSFIGGTQADPTGIAVKTDPKAVGHLYRFVPDGDTETGRQGDKDKPSVPAALARGAGVKVEDLGTPVPGQGIYTLAYLAKSQEIVGNTWPDGHFFTYDLKTKQFKDHGAIAGHRPFETPQHAEDVSRGTGKKVSYPRVVSRAIAIDSGTGAYTAGAGGWLHRYDPARRVFERLDLRLPAAAGREPLARLDAAVVYPRASDDHGDYACLLGGTSDGHLIELRIYGRGEFQLRARGKVLSSPGIQALAKLPGPTGGTGGRGAGGGGGAGPGGGFGQGGRGHAVVGLGGTDTVVPRSFRFSHGGSTSSVLPGIIPTVDRQSTLVPFSSLVDDGQGQLYAGETDRLARLLRFPLDPLARTERKPAAVVASREHQEGSLASLASLPRLQCQIAFAPEGTTTDGSGYTAIEVGKDGKVYVGSARYGDYGWLLRFDPRSSSPPYEGGVGGGTKPLDTKPPPQPILPKGGSRSPFMEKVASLRDLTGERLAGINTQAKIHAKIVVGHDGRIWFASKQGHEIFDTRPEYDDPDGYPGGHLCWYDPKTGHSRSMGILMSREGLQGGVIDAKRNRIYLRSEPKNHFLVYDIGTGEVQDRGHVGAACRYMAIDASGVVWTVGRGKTLCRYDPVTNYVEEVPILVDPTSAAPEYTPPYVIALGPNGKLYGAGTSHAWIMEFDVENASAKPQAAVTMRNIAPAAPQGLPVSDIHAGVFGKDGRFYYPLLTTFPATENAKAEQRLILMRFDANTKQTVAVGVPEIAGFDEEQVKSTYPRPAPHKLDHIQGMAVGDDGTLFMMDIYPQLNVVWFPRLTAR